jgi:hypothetical protein
MMKRVGSQIILQKGDAYDTWKEEQRKYMDALIDEWQWLLEGTKKQALTPIPKKHWGVMAMLFQNQREATLEATTKTDVTLPEVYSLPIIRKVWPNLVAFKIASERVLPGLSAGGCSERQLGDARQRLRTV